MKLEDVKKEDALAKDMSEAQMNDLFSSIIRGKDVTEVIKTSRGDFKVKFPRTRDVEAIGRVLAFRLNGLPVQSVDPSVYNLMQQVATLDVVVLEGPAWFENAKKEGHLETWGDIPVQSFIQEVYAKAYTFRREVQERLEKGEDRAGAEVASGERADVADGDGLFEGLSGQS